MIILPASQTAVCHLRALGALTVLVAVQLSVTGSYLPPVLVTPVAYPPHTIISLPVQTAVCKSRAVGEVKGLVGSQLYVDGLYLPPVFTSGEAEFTPPHMIISLPVLTAVA